jgi:hypothetical protein
MRSLCALLTLIVLSCTEDSEEKGLPNAEAAAPRVVTARPCAASDTAYFGPTLRPGYETWYGGTLRAMREPVLCSAPGAERYRFLWLRSFHSPIAIRVEHRQGQTTLVAKRLRMTGDEIGGALEKDTSFALTAEEWAKLEDFLRKAKYWEVPTEWPQDPNFDKLDGAQWVLEGATSTRYHLVDRWSASSDARDVAFTQACLFLLDISGLTPPPSEIY